jgi:hypothetical protein
MEDSSQDIVAVANKEIKLINALENENDEPKRIFVNNPQTCQYFTTCASEVSNSGQRHFLAAFDGDVPIVTYGYSPESSTYVTSTESHYVDYAWDEVVFHTSNVAIKFLCMIILFFIRMMCRFSNVDDNDVCFFNASLISTNLYRDEKKVAESYQRISQELAQEHNKQIVIFRCLDRIGTPELLHASMNDPNTLLVASRVVNQLDINDDSVWQRSNCKKDAIVLERYIGATRKEIRDVQNGTTTIKDVIERCERESLKSSHILRKLRVDEPLEVYQRLQTVYEQLYLRKYSSHNPGYTAIFFQNVSTVWDIVVLQRRSDNFIEGFMCVMDIGGPFVSCPALGYDMDNDTPSYIILQFWAILEAKSRGKRLNMSGGVTKYKQMRGAVPVVEYSAVKFSDKVGLRRKIFWLAMSFLTHWVARPLMKRKSIT